MPNKLFIHYKFSAFPKAQSSQGLKLPVRLILIAFSVSWVITSEGWPIYAFRIFIFFFWCWTINFAIWALLKSVSWRNITLATRPWQVLVQQSKTVLPLLDCTTILLLWSLCIMLPCQNVPVNKKRFQPTLVLYFLGHYT